MLTPFIILKNKNTLNLMKNLHYPLPICLSKIFVQIPLSKIVCKVKPDGTNSKKGGGGRVGPGWAGT